MFTITWNTNDRFCLNNHDHNRCYQACYCITEEKGTNNIIPKMYANTYAVACTKRIGGTFCLQMQV